MAFEISKINRSGTLREMAKIVFMGKNLINLNHCSSSEYATSTRTKSIWRCVFTLFLCFSFVNVGIARALPWDIDMYSQQSLRSNEVARSPVPGTKPVGYEPFRMTIEEADKHLSNPVPISKNSVWRGQRLWNTQCAACHGVSGESNTRSGKLMGAPNLLDERFKAYSDGKVYGTIYWGIRSMPRYGYKFSTAEGWDVVNYYRFLQGADVAGIENPSEVSK